MHARSWQPWTSCPCNGCKTSNTACVHELYQAHRSAWKQARKHAGAGRLHALQCELGGTGTSRLCLGAKQDTLGEPVGRPPLHSVGVSCKATTPIPAADHLLHQSMVHLKKPPAQLSRPQAPCCSWETCGQTTLHSHVFTFQNRQPSPDACTRTLLFLGDTGQTTGHVEATALSPMQARCCLEKVPPARRRGGCSARQPSTASTSSTARRCTPCRSAPPRRALRKQSWAPGSASAGGAPFGSDGYAILLLLAPMQMPRCRQPGWLQRFKLSCPISQAVAEAFENLGGSGAGRTFILLPR